MSEQLARMPELLSAHTRLTLLALSLAVAISLPLGIASFRKPKLGRVVVAFASVVQTIPGLALLAVMVPVLALLALPSIGVLPALLGLTLYGVLPILQNTIAALGGIEPLLIEAARGVGMTDAQRLRQVELPLALPVIVAGVRTGTVWTVGMATLSTPIGAPSLGNYIFGGLQTRSYDAVLLGCAGSAALALVLDALIRLLERGIRERQRRFALLGGLGLTLVAALSIAPLVHGQGPAGVRVGAKTFTEQYILAELLAEEVRAADLNPEVVSSLGSTVVFDALVAGEIDLYVEYTGTVLATFMHDEGAYARDEALSRVRAWLRERHGVELLAALGFENTYALAVRPQEGVRTIGELATRSSSLSFGTDYEFSQRPEWSLLRDRYGLAFAETRAMDPSLMYEAIELGQVDVISAYSTDGRIAALGLVVLDDTHRVIPPYDAVLLARRGFATDYPALTARLRMLEGTIPPDRMRALNRDVDEHGVAPAEVARRFLAER